MVKFNRVNHFAMAIVAGAGFVSRGFAGGVEHLTSLIKAGITHQGFTLIDILQPCVSFNHKNTYSWYQERVYKLENEANYARVIRYLPLIKPRNREGEY